MPAQGVAGISPIGLGTALDVAGVGTYDNNFANISRIADRMAGVEPYAINSEGDKVEDTQLCAVLRNPNRQMSAVRFRNTLATVALVNPCVYLLVWHGEGRKTDNGWSKVVAGGKITAENIAGFTFIQNPSIDRRPNGQTVYMVDRATYTDDEVIALSLASNPYDVLSGYSPSLAAKRWATLDDYINAYQRGYFKNGAVPSGVFVITAPSVDEYNAIVDSMKATHRGAGHNNNVIYTHRPLDAMGQASASQIEWRPFSSSNRDLDLSSLISASERAKDTIFGVPAEVKGYLSNSNYASVNVAERIFDKYVVLPKLTALWSDFTHEMNRITGGLGYALSFDFDLAVMADEEKTTAETTATQFATYQSALQAGYTQEQAIEGLGLPQSFYELGNIAPKTDEAKIVEVAEKAVEPVGKNKPLNKQEQRIADAMKKEMEAQVKLAVDGVEDTLELAEARHEQAVGEIMDVLTPTIVESGASAQLEIAQTITLDSQLPVDTTFRLSEKARTSYTEYLKKVLAISYDEDTAEAIRMIFEQAAAEAWNQAQTTAKLWEIPELGIWRANRLARTEYHRAEQLGGLDAAKQIEEETGVKLTKIWHTLEGACPDCAEKDGNIYALDDYVVEAQGEYPAQLCACEHPNCRCWFSYGIASEQKSVKVVCPKCGRYLFESKGCKVDNIICQNSKCKAHLNIEVSKGKITANEVEVK